MKKLILCLVLLMALAPVANAAMESFVVFSGQGAAIAIDALGADTNEEGYLYAEIPANATIQAAYLYSADVWGGGLYDVVFEGETLTSSASTRLDVATKDANDASENRWDVTSIVASKYDGIGGDYQFSVVETGYLDGEILAVIYTVAGGDVQTVLLFDGELATTGDSFNVGLSDSYDGSSDAIMSLGISFGYQGSDQYTEVDINGNRLTSSAGGQDDALPSYQGNGWLITAGGYGDNTDNPANPNAGPGGDYRYDDELYNLAPFLSEGDNLITLDTLNPSNNDNVFFMALTVKGEADVDPPPQVPEPATMLLLGTGLLGLAGLRRRLRR